MLNIILNKPKSAFALCMVVVAFFLYQLLSLQINPTTYLLDPSHPARVADAELESIFTATGATVSIVVVPKQEGDLNEDSATIPSTDTIALLSKLTQSLEAIVLWDEEDKSTLATYKVDKETSKLVDQIIGNGLSYSTATSLTQLRDMLKKKIDWTIKDKFFFRNLLISIDPVKKVRSLSTFEDIVDEDDSLDVDKLFETIPKNEGDIALLNAKIDDNPLVIGAFISKNKRAHAIQIELNATNDDAEIITRAHREIMKIVDISDSKFDYHIGGTAVITNALSHYLKKDNDRFFPFVLLVIIVVLVISFKSLEGVYVPLLVAISSLVATLGVLPLVGIKQNMITTMIPIFVMATAVADSIHFLNHFNKTYEKNGGLLREAIVSTYNQLFRALTFTTITTALGFLSLSYTNITFIREFGAFVALGVVFAYLFTLVLLPAMLILKKKRGLSIHDTSQPFFMKLVDKVVGYIAALVRHHKPVVFTVIAATAISSTYYAFNVNVDYEGITMYPEDARLRVDDRAINKHFDGVVPLSIRLNGNENGVIYSEEAIKYIEHIEAELLKHPHVGYILSPNSYLKRMDFILNNGDKDLLSPEMSSALASQYYLLYDNSSGQDIRDVVDNAYRFGRIIVLLEKDRASVSREIINIISSIPKPDSIEISYAGIAGLIVQATDEVVYGQINSLTISTCLVLIIMSVLFRSIFIGFVAVIPLALTLLINFGVLGISGLDLDVATSLIAAIVLGVGIDYAIHFVEAVRRGLQANLSREDALDLAITQVGPPIIINSLTLAGGFFVLTVSSFQPLVYLGGLISLTMIISALTTLLVLPLLLSYLPANVLEKSTSPENNRSNAKVSPQEFM